jgi:hypothetical protein
MTKIVREKLGYTATKRFIPYVQMHEFEGLLFSDPERLAVGIEREDLTDYFQLIKNRFATPEEINDNFETAPSKRIEKKINDYEKPLMGCMAALEIGLKTIRKECKLFNAWLEQLETLGRDEGN